MDQRNNSPFGREPTTYINPDTNPGMSGGVILGIAVAIAVAGGAIWYTVKMPTPTAGNTPAITTGQNTPRIEAPLINAVTPAPITTPAPQALPMPTPEPTPPLTTAPNP